MKTKTSIEFGLVDVTAKQDGTFTTTDKQDFIDLTQLKRDSLEVRKLATLEKDFFRLDGTFELFPDTPQNYDFGLWSKIMSGENGEFETPIILTIDFTENHSSLGLTFTFYEPTEDYCNNLNVKWYDGTNTLLSDMDFTPDKAIYFADNKIENYKKIVITFYGTNKPYRYLKLSQIAFGQIKVFDSNDLISANILEEVDPISAELRINTLDFVLHNKNAEFSIINPSGIYALLQERQPLTAYEYLDGLKKNMGTFYLDDWQNESESTFSMSAIDLIGVIDGTDFKGGIYTNVNAGVIINEIMTSANADYEIDTSLSLIKLSGYIPICTHREALQQVAFVIGGIVDCSRSNKIKIYKAPAESSVTISYSRKLQGHKVKLKTLVTGVEVTSHNYVASTETVELFKNNLSVGTHEITFNEPVHSLSITGATIGKSGANYAVINVTVAGQIILSGKKYIDNTKVVGVYNPNLPAGEKTNIVSVKKATLISDSNASIVAQRLYDYYQNRLEDEGRIILRDEKCGDLVVLDSLHEQQIQGYIEKLDINLTGGFIANATIVGDKNEL